MAKAPNTVTRWRQSLLSVVALLVLAAAVWHEQGAAQGPPKPIEIVVAFGTDATTLDPHMSTQISDTDLFYNIFDGLLRRDKSLKLVPALAVSWRNVNPTTWEFKLRENVQFHNGERFDANAVKFSIERILDPSQKVFVASQWNTVREVQVVSPYLVRIITKEPDPLLPARTASYGREIIPPQYFQQVGAQAFARRPIGTGAWVLKEWKKDERIVLDANKKWWGGAPSIDKVTVRPIPESATRVAALLAGEVDLVASVPPAQVDVITRSGNAKVKSAPQATMIVFMVDVRKGVLGDKRFRQAISLAIDRPSLVKNLYRGYAKIPNGPIADTDFSYDPAAPPLPYDPEKAKALLREVAYKGEVVELDTPEGAFPQDRELTEAMAGMLEKVGINAKVNVIELSVRVQKIRSQAFNGLYNAAPYSTLLDPDGVLWRLLAPGSSHRYWQNAEFDKVMAEARGTVDQGRRLGLYRKGIALMMDEMPWIVISQAVYIWGHTKQIEYTPRGDERLIFAEIAPARTR